MRYTLFSVFALTALTNALPVAEPEVNIPPTPKRPNNDTLQAQLTVTEPGSTIELSPPSTVITWGKRELALEPNKSEDTIELGKPTTEVTWGKRGVEFEKPKDTIQLGKPTTEVAWGKQ